MADEPTVEILVDPAQFSAVSQRWVRGTGDTDPATADPDFVQHTFSLPVSVFTQLAREIAKAINQREYLPARLVIGDDRAIVTPEGSLLTIGPNGEVYRDGEQLPGIAAQQVVRFGMRVYAQGKTNPSWWRWTGSGWVAVTAFDSRVLMDVPAP